MVSCTGVRIPQFFSWQGRCGVITLGIGGLVWLGRLRRLRLVLSIVATDCCMSGLATNLADRSRRGCIRGEIGTASSVVERSTSPVGGSAATTTKVGRAGGDVRSGWVNINARNLLFQSHFVSKEVAVKFINGQWVDSGCDRSHKWIVFGAEPFEKKRNTLKIVERLSGGSKSITKRLYSLKIFGDRVGAFLDRCELEVNLHDPSTGLRSEHGEQRVPERGSRGRADCMDDIGLGQCRN
jgi:hypothetical protein